MSKIISARVDDALADVWESIPNKREYLEKVLSSHFFIEAEIEKTKTEINFTREKLMKLEEYLLYLQDTKKQTVLSDSAKKEITDTIMLRGRQYFIDSGAQKIAQKHNVPVEQVIDYFNRSDKDVASID